MSALLDAPDSSTVVHSGEIDASPPVRPGGRRVGVRFGISQLLFGASLLLVWALVYLLGLSGLEQARTQNALYQDLRTQLAAGTAPMGAPIAVGAPVALLSVPDAGIDDVVVVEGSRPAQLQDGPGHVLGSVLPGQAGVSVVAGRSTTFGGPFGGLTDLSRGSRVTVTTAQGIFTYQVSGTREEGDPVPPALDAGEARLSFLTSTGRGLSSGRTVYVDAVLTGQAAVAGPRAAQDPDSRSMSAGADVTTLALLALALQLLVLSLVGFNLAWQRWSRTGAWIALAPAVLASLWLVSSLGSRLLPGLV